MDIKNIDKPYYVASFSGGKDSTAMLLRLIELGEPIDEIIFCDTTMEYPPLYRHVKKIEKYVTDLGYKFTRLKAEKSFEEYMLNHEFNRSEDSKYYGQIGYGWSSAGCRWCTRILKLNVIDKYLSDIRKEHFVITYLGFAYDEQNRVDRLLNIEKGKCYPLHEWKWSEEMALQYCYDHGYDWDGLYNYVDRVSCWCCPLQNLDSLRVLRKKFPRLWKRLRELDKKSINQFRSDFSVEQLEVRFYLEDRWLKRGWNINGINFRNEMRKKFKERGVD